jgi:gametolysin|nr:MAG TPA: peptidoglycan hydrolase [Caudoviricetes sp.]DAN46858.1 MAG TPA: peptidoglycan hydrolase [Caudoviricetes sp.]
MAIKIENAIAWMEAREGKVSYNMEYRDGDDSYDCSSAMYYSLRSAGASSAGWAVNTEYMHDWLIKNGYELIAENTECNAQRGDIFIWGKRGASAGAFGHTGMFIDSDNIIHCNYAYNGISINNHDERWYYAGQPYFYIYRLTNPNAQPEEVKKGWQKDDTGYWYVRANGSYPKSEFEYIEENKSWFYFDESGYMYSDKWLHHTDGHWYHFDKDGYMATSWKKINEKWYYFNRDGAMQIGWVKWYEKWYYLDDQNGDMKSSTFVPYNGGYYLLLPDGRLADKESFTVEPDGLITAK